MSWLQPTSKCNKCFLIPINWRMCLILIKHEISVHHHCCHYLKSKPFVDKIFKRMVKSVIMSKPFISEHGTREINEQQNLVGGISTLTSSRTGAKRISELNEQQNCWNKTSADKEAIKPIKLVHKPTSDSLHLPCLRLFSCSHSSGPSKATNSAKLPARTTNTPPVPHRIAPKHTHDGNCKHSPFFQVNKPKEPL